MSSPTALLPWTQRPLGALLRLAWPIAVSMLSYSLMTVTDTAFVGRLGAEALAAVGLGGVAVLTLIALPWGLLRAVKVLVSQAVGAGDLQAVNRYRNAGLALAFAMGLLVIALGQALLPFLSAFSSGAQAGLWAGHYAQIRVCAAPLALLAAALRETLYGVGESRAPMRSALFANALNLPLNALFIFGLGWGVAGAAWATLLAQGGELAYLAFGQRGSSFRRISMENLRSILQVGWATGLEFLLDISALSLIVVLIARMGEVQMAAHQIVFQLAHVAFLPALAIAEAASVLTGQAVGANQDALAKRIAFRALLATVAYTTLWAVLFVVAADLLLSLFTGDGAVLQAARWVLYAAALAELFHGAHVTARGVLRGTGDVRFPAMITVGLAWLCTPPLTYFLGLRLGWGAVGGWLGIAGELLFGSVILWWRLMGNGWRPAAQMSRARLEDKRSLSAQPWESAQAAS